MLFIYYLTISMLLHPTLSAEDYAVSRREKLENSSKHFKVAKGEQEEGRYYNHEKNITCVASTKGRFFNEYILNEYGFLIRKESNRMYSEDEFFSIFILGIK